MDDLRALLARERSAAVLYLPHLALAGVIALAGVVLAFVVGRVVTAALTRRGFDRLADRTGVIDDLARVGVGMRPARLIGRLAFWIVLAAALVQAINALELATVSASLASFVAFLPHIVIAVVLVFAGIVVGDVVGRGTSGSMSRAGVLYHDVTGGFVRGAIIVIAVLTALQQLTIESSFFFEIVLVGFASLALAFAIACGWGGRRFIENAFAGRYVERHFAVGDRIAFDGVHGTIERFEPLSTLVRTGDGRRMVLPNSVLTSAVVEIDERPQTGE